ncbi:hypothetical protein GCM10007907_35180 [Chitinimonas prasina]|uniref:FAD:protein FMN transferase n=1 Tax=Chitinimonas prasina TaxID=1434937 RepID=A0ABQ5YJV7_9NEIS|nr:DUF2271 domain-containing protein [Chitinimonas prasina]GLR14728.1 hypothetical protein GCM10007907_35180 [Chitinimonas prasina]
MQRTPWPLRLSLGSKLLAAAGLLLPQASQAASLPAMPATTPATASQTQVAPHWRFHRDHVLGTSLDLITVGGNEATGREALAVAQAEIDRLDRVLSRYRADSELAALNQCEQMQASEALYEVVAACEQWRTRTQGAFSARLGVALALWQDAGFSGKLDTDAIARAVAAAEAAEVKLDPTSRTITRPADVVFAPDALAKGYIIDRAMQAVRNQVEGLDGLLIDIGGDIRSWGRAPQASGWQLGVAQANQPQDNAPLVATLQLGSKAVATSGRGQRDIEINGMAHAHIVSPQTGAAVTEVSSVTVVADRAADADALSTAFAVMPAAQSLALADRLPGVATLLQLADGSQLQSAAWQDISEARSSLAPRFIYTADAATAPWPAGFTASIDYEVPKIEAENYKAPFVAIWITDQNRAIVRNLTHLGNQEKWIDSNYVWWRRYGRKIEKLDTVTKPTRKPGKYSLAWDGTDEAGRKVGQGKYLVHIEAAREHGGHTYQTFEIELGSKPLSLPQAAKDELGGVVLRYGKSA